jgi:hypothetical protein
VTWGDAQKGDVICMTLSGFKGEDIDGRGA